MVQRPIEVVLKGGEFRQYSDLKFALLRKQYDMKRAEFEVIYYLSICKDADSLVNITEFLNANKGHISSTVYGLTEKGKAVAADIDKVWKDIRNELFSGLTEEEISSFKKIFYKICKNIEHFKV